MIKYSRRSQSVAFELCRLFEVEFGGKPRGRYRICEKLLRHLFVQSRLYPETITQLQRKIFELGFVLIDMDGFFVVIGAKTLSTYRRAGPAVVGYIAGDIDEDTNFDDQSDE